LAFEFPVGVVDEDQDSWPSALQESLGSARFSLTTQVLLASPRSPVMIGIIFTYTVPSRTNMSCRGSFIRFLHSQSMRKPTLTGEFVAGSVDGRATLWDLWEEKRSSRPPLENVIRSWDMHV